MALGARPGDPQSLGGVRREAFGDRSPGLSGEMENLRRKTNDVFSRGVLLLPVLFGSVP